jgi:teichuronic acid exporter
MRQTVTFGVSVVLARLLSPADFGIIALLTFFSSLSIIFVQGGLSEALIQQQATSRDEESAVFWWNFGASLIFGASLVGIGPLVAKAYGHAVLAPLMGVAALQTIFAALSAVQTALMTRGLRFDLLARAGVTSSIVSAVAAIGAAAAGAGIWALAVQLLVSAATNTVMLWAGSSWRPSFHFRFSTIRHMLRFGGWLSLSSGLEVFYSQGFALLLGKIYGVRELGFFNRAASTQQLPANLFSGIIGRVAFPLFAARKEDRAGLRRGLLLAIRMVMLVNVPLMAALCLLSDIVIQVLFGDKWLPAARVLSILAGSGLLFPLQVLNLQLLLALGESRTYFKLEIIKKSVGVCLVVAGSFLGVEGLAYSMLTLALVALFVNVEPVRRGIGAGVWTQIVELRGVIVATAVMIVTLVIVRPWLPAAPMVRLPLLTVIGGCCYLGLGFGARLHGFPEVWALVTELRHGKGPIAAADAVEAGQP